MYNLCKKERNRKKYLTSILILLIMTLFITSCGNKDEGTISYGELIKSIKNEEVVKVESVLESTNVTVTFKDGEKYKILVPNLYEFNSFISEEIKNGASIEYIVYQDSILSELLGELILIGIILAIAYFSLRSIIKELAKKTDEMTNLLKDEKYEIVPANSKTKFTDVAGIDEEKEQLKEIVKFLQTPERYVSIGAKIPKGVLLTGQPGTGKTLLAKAIAGEAGVPFFQVNGSSFDEKYVGVGASRVRKLFEHAKKVAPCIVFIDELDSVAKSRYKDNSYNEQTLNQLLSEMDGFDSKDNKVIVIAATNYLSVLDPAITRPGRFDRQVYVPMPDVIAREKILLLHAKKMRFLDTVSFKDIAKKTVGFSGADLANVLNEAAIYAVNQGKAFISEAEIDEAIARVMVGLEKKNVAVTKADRWLTAVHESGHAIVSAIVRPNIKNLGISIVPRGTAGGYNIFDELDTPYKRKSNIKKELLVLYGGRAAEDIILKDISSGASNDLERASKLALLMVNEYAMNNNLLVKVKDETSYNDTLDNERIEEAEKICKDAYNQTVEIIKQYKEQLLNLAKILCDKECLSQEEVTEFMKNNVY